ncbi:hypothetical protein NA643_01545 [Pseudomonas stutzeri]|uniref:hypothetical protein n=1 Tax=Stutzerimonas stutzeri TaxID=316 RepID=UPI000C99DC3F|nr:hypothetical protein [Stutzerimonas stutzeri]MCQ4277760.1 hypothetical protein [Stutzerimonas stutzeri]PNF73567.1 hypothetical protein CXK96_07170 [Stutzerimonas stutzeri]
MELNRPSRYDIACHFCVSRIAGAAVPYTRLSNILEGMFHGRPLTALSLSYLQQQNLNELHQLATGQITYEAFIAAFDPALVARERAARVEHQAKEAERLAQEAERVVQRKREGEAAESARIARTAQYDRDRQDAEAACFVREAEWAAQRTLNCEAAEAMYKARMSEPGYIALAPYDIARHYRVSHLEGVVTSPLSNILAALYQGRPLSAAYLNYLKIKGLPRLYALAIGQVTYESYISDLNAAEVVRTTAETRLALAEAQKRRRDAAEAALIARESDPAYILRKKYGVLAIAQPLLPRLMDILQNIDAGNRLTDDDFVWLNTEGQVHFTEKLRKTHYLREAEFCGNEYRRTQDPWNAINASGHYRKCNQPESALELLASVPTNRLRHPKVHSAICTTQGGVMRDLGRRDEAYKLGKQGHELMPKNFRPCTLLGAVCMELGDYMAGHDWYAKAEERGASKQSIDIELRGIFARADNARRGTMRASLLAKDPDRYRWANEKKYRSESAQKS